MTETTWLWLDRIGIVWADLMLLATFAGGIVAVFKRGRIRDWWRRNRFPDIGRDLGQDERWPAFLLNVSKPDLPKWLIENQQPAAIALLATEQSRETADDIKAFAEKHGAVVLGPYHIDDPDDPSESHALAATLLQRLKQKGHARIAVDVTGGKVPMSIGAFMAAEEAGCDSIYISADFDRELKKPKPQTARIRCISCPNAD